MTYTLELSELAEADLAEAMEWYKRIRPGLEAAIALCVEETLDRILDNPEMFPGITPGVRRAIVRRFPYLVIFRVRKRRIEIEALFHPSRDPKRWQSRLSRMA
jgi:plasmid stabilization system protein ParE